MRVTLATAACLALSLAVASALATRQVRDIDDYSFESDSNVNVLRSDLEGRGFDDLCTTLYNTIVATVPQDIVDMITAFSLLPEELLAGFFGILLPWNGAKILGLIASCWRTGATAKFGEDPSAARAILDGNIRGDIFFAQSLERQDKPSALAVFGSFEGLEPSKRYTVKVYQSGDVSSSCDNVGDEFLSLGGAQIESNSDGRAILLLKETQAKLDGAVNILGRSVVVTPVGGGASTCAAITRNIVAPL